MINEKLTINDQCVNDQRALPLWLDERVGFACCAGASGTTDTVDIVIVGVGLVKVDDVRDVRDIEATGGDVGSDEDTGLA